jgi:hypothetical protein
MRRTRTETKTTTGLHVCPECGSRLVQPTCWEQAAPQGHWRLWRRCPECEWECSSIHGEREIDDFDEELDNGTQELVEGLKSLQRSIMEEMAETFVVALDADLIGADDFQL